MLLPEDFKEFIELMIAANVRFVMIGGYAYNLYRNPRATGDIDFIVSQDSENQSKLRRVLTDFGFGTSLPTADHPVVERNQVLMLGRAPFRIDIMAEIDGVTFEEVERTCESFQIDNLVIPVISAKLLLKNKRSTGRAKDATDAEALENWLLNEGEDAE